MSEYLVYLTVFVFCGCININIKFSKQNVYYLCSLKSCCYDKNYTVMFNTLSVLNNVCLYLKLIVIL